jgi:hypothetical protein
MPSDFLHTETFIDGESKSRIGSVLINTEKAIGSCFMSKQLSFTQRAKVIPTPCDHSIRLLRYNAGKVNGVAWTCVDALRFNENLLIDPRGYKRRSRHERIARQEANDYQVGTRWPIPP